MPAVLRARPPPPGENQPFVIGTQQRAVEPPEQASKIIKSAVNSVEDNNTTLNQTEESSKLAVQLQSAPCQDENPSLPADIIAVSEQSASRKETDVETAPENASSPERQDAIIKKGLFERIWKIWNGPQASKFEVSPYHEGAKVEPADGLSASQQDQNDNRDRKPSGKTTTSIAAVNSCSPTVSVRENSDKGKSEDKAATSISESSSLGEHASLSKEKTESQDGSSVRSFFTWITRWWTFGKSNVNETATTGKDTDGTRTDSTNEAKPSSSASSQQVVNDILSQSYFWDPLEQFLLSRRGSDIVFKSRTRAELMNVLQKEGPWLLKELKEGDLQKLVDMLFEKKWIEENFSQSYPFRLTIPRKRTCVPSHSSNSNGSSSLFTPETSASSLERSSVQEKYVDNQTKRRHPTRDDILSDCHKLLTLLFEEYPNGFNMSIFRPEFAQKYGYVLDCQKLGYPKLASLLQLMPGVIIQSSMVLPAERFTSQNGRNIAVGMENEAVSNGDDCVWEELGPVSDNVKDMASLADEELFTESDDDSTIEGRDPRLQKPEEENSLLQILDSWYGGKDDGAAKKSQNVDGFVDCSEKDQGSSINVNLGDLSKQKVRPQKRYSFVSQSGDEKDKLVDNILGTLKKAGESRLQG